MGGTLDDGTEISAKYVGNERLVEIAVATLATDRALLLYGVPGTAKSWVSEHLAAAISGDSTLLVQGTAGTDESALRYGWNYARLLVEGPSEAAMTESPMLRAMKTGAICRVGGTDSHSVRGAGHADYDPLRKDAAGAGVERGGAGRAGVQRHSPPPTTRDRGVNELSSALMRRFNTVVLPTPENLEDEVAIVRDRSAALGRALELPAEAPALEEVRRVVTVFRELRGGLTEDGKTKLKSPTGTLSTAEAISVVNSGAAMAAFYGDGVLNARDLAAGLTGAVVKDPVRDRVVWQEYLQTVVKERDGWGDFYRACRETL